MADNTNFSFHAGSAEKVALELAEKIALHSGMAATAKDEAYWLKLYAACRKVVYGGRPE